MSKTSIGHKAMAPKNLNFAVVVCSSSRFLDLKARKPVDDSSGDLIVETLHEAGHNVVLREIVPDDRTFIGKYVNLNRNFIQQPSEYPA